MQNILYHGVICVLKLSCHIYQIKNYFFFIWGTEVQQEKGRKEEREIEEDSEIENLPSGHSLSKYLQQLALG